MPKRRLVFDQLEVRTALCAAFGGTVADVATEGIGLPTEQGNANDNASEVGGYKSGGHQALFDSVSDAIQFQLKENGGACNPPS